MLGSFQKMTQHVQVLVIFKCCVNMWCYYYYIKILFAWFSAGNSSSLLPDQ